MKFRSTAGLSPLLVLFACGGNIDATGHYETTPESLKASFEATFPPAEDPEGQKLRGRFEQMRTGAQVTLNLDPDATFSMTMKLPGVPKPQTRAGTWRQSGATVQLHTTHEGGQALPEPTTRPATVTEDTIALQIRPNSPRFVLQKKE